MSQLWDVLPGKIWHPLVNPDSIRIVEIFDESDENAPLRCRLHHTSILSSEYPYRAISYAWATTSRTEWVEVCCDEWQALIPPTLHSALMRARKKLKKMYYWTDCLCINQGDDPEALKERATQVKMMDKIFSGAAEVIVDLGSIDAEDVIMLTRLWQSFPFIPDTKWDEVLQTPPVDEADSQFADLKLPLLKEGSFWVRFALFVSRPYFTRIWVIQEMVFARRAGIMIGPNLCEINFLRTCLMRALNYYWRLHDHCSTLLLGWDIAEVIPRDIMTKMTVARDAIQTTILLGAVEYQPEKRFDLATLLLLTRSRHASVTHDKVFALLGLAADNDIDKFQVDYEESESECARRLSTYLIHQGKGPWVLHNSRGSSSSGRSWDYSLSPQLGGEEFDELSGLLTLANTAFSTPFSAHGGSDADFRIDGDQLIVVGFFIGTVESPTSPMPVHITESDRHARDELRELKLWYIELENWLSTYAPIAHGQGSLSEFRTKCWQVVTTDRFLQGRLKPRRSEAPPSLLSSQDAFMEFTQSLQHQATTDVVGADDKFASGSEFFRSTLLGMRKRLAMVRGRNVVVAAADRKAAPIRLCLLPEASQAGDCLVILKGCPIPFCLRRRDPASNTDLYRIIGPCYIDAMMDGQVLESDNYYLPQSIALC